MSRIDYTKDEKTLKTWNEFKEKESKLLHFGLQTGNIRMYDIEEVKKAREYFYRGIPLSVTMLSFYMCNGRCHEMSFSLARMLLDDPDTLDLRIVIADVDSLKLNPMFIGTRDDYAHHFVVYRETKNHIKLIYDTTTGLVYNSRFWFLIESPTNMKFLKKEDVREMIENEKRNNPDDFKPDYFHPYLIIPEIEKCYGQSDEEYSQEGYELLQNEVNVFKKIIGYDEYYKTHKNDIDSLIKTFHVSKEKMENNETD